MCQKFNTTNRFKTITFGKRYSDKTTTKTYEFIVVPHRKSIKIDGEMFTNFLSDNGGDRDQITALKKINEEIHLHRLEVSDFDRKELSEVKEETDRIVRIINSYGNVQINSICEVFKCKYRKMPKVQIYLRPINNELQIVLIDVHHLGLKGDFSKTVKYDREKLYKKCKNRTKCISEIITE